MLVWGGVSRSDDSEIALTDGGVYDVEEREWLPLSVEGEVSALGKSFLTWVSDKLVLWGSACLPSAETCIEPEQAFFVDVECSD